MVHVNVIFVPTPSSTKWFNLFLFLPHGLCFQSNASSSVGLRDPAGKLRLTAKTYSVDGLCSNLGRDADSFLMVFLNDRLCGLVVGVLGYRSRGPGSIPGTTRKKSSGSGTGSTQPREYN
jgi:hypothetical protein